MVTRAEVDRLPRGELLALINNIERKADRTADDERILQAAADELFERETVGGTSLSGDRPLIQVGRPAEDDPSMDIASRAFLGS